MDTADFGPSDIQLADEPQITIYLSTDGKCTVQASGDLAIAESIYEKVLEIYQKIQGDEGIFKTSDVYKSKEVKTPVEPTPTPAQGVTRNLCPKCGAAMVYKEGISKSTGRPFKFWSCSTYPKCDGVRAVVANQ